MASVLKMGKLMKMLQNAQQGFQTAQGLTGSLKPFLGQYGGEFGNQANNFLSMLGLGNDADIPIKKMKIGGRYNPSQNRNFATNAHWAKMGFGNNGVSGGRRFAQSTSFGGDPLNIGRNDPYGRNNPSASYTRPSVSDLGWNVGRGGAFKGKSPLSSNPNASNSLDIMNLIRTAQQAQQIYDQVKQGSNMVKPYLPTNVSNFLTSWGLGKPRRNKSGSDGRSARAKIVREVMQSQGVSLPMASKIVKEQGLYSGGRMVNDRAFRETAVLSKPERDRMMRKQMSMGGAVSGGMSY
jgi:hypothetical protein